MTYRYEAPERLESDWLSGKKTPPDEMKSELRGDVDDLVAKLEEGPEITAIEGRVSDYKSWLAAALAVDLAEADKNVTVFAPQTANRESAVFKLRQFGANLIEHPGRIDLCIWEPWRENVGRVDKTTCESIGCPFYLDSDPDIADRTGDALSAHILANGGGVDLYAGDNRREHEDWAGPEDGDMKRLGEDQDMCPAQMYLDVRSMSAVHDAVNVSTYAKAFADAAIAKDAPLDSDVVLLDEAHTVSADMEVIVDDVEPESVLGSLDSLVDRLEDSGQRWAQRARDDLMLLRGAVAQWVERSREYHVSPEGVFAGDTASLGDSFDALDRVEGRLLQSVRRKMRRNDWQAVERESEPYLAAGEVREFLSLIMQYRDGVSDFIHSLYEEGGDRVNDMAFRRTSGSAFGSGVTPGAVVERWREEGTHPAIEARWGPLLDHYIESLWDGRTVRTSGDMPGAPMMPIDRLREIAGADSVATLSATHNELSDPTRDPDRLRPTRHKLVCAPVYLRSEGSERDDYHGKDTASPDTPWFRQLVVDAAEASDDRLAAVPINYSNSAKWRALPVESVEIDDGDDGKKEVHGVVPNSRGSIGEKGLEHMEIDTVLCGVQVQGPAPTARLLMQWWEALSPRRDDPSDVLSDSWKLLAQHAVSGTIQAGGRFDWGATNLVFERPGLFELAGFEVETATPDTPGFAGELARIYGSASGEWERRRASVRAKRVVGYLNGADRKTASINQSVGEYKRAYGADEAEARRSLRVACERGDLEATTTDRGVRFETT